jgi:hypothetical protein
MLRQAHNFLLTRFADNYDPAAQNDPMSNYRQFDLRHRSIKAGTIVTAASFSCSLSTDHWKHP